MHTFLLVYLPFSFRLNFAWAVMCFVFNVCFFHVLERQSLSERKREIRESLHLLIHFSDACNRQGWARPKSGAQHSVQVSMWVAGAQIPEPSSAAPGCISKKLNWKLMLRDSHQHSDGGCGLLEWQLTTPQHPAPTMCF